MARIEDLAHDTPGVADTVGISGQSLIAGANAPNLGSMYVMLDDFSQRRAADLTADAISAALLDRCRREVQGAIVTRLRTAAHRRPGHDRRLQADRRRPRQPGHRQPAAGRRPGRRPRQPHAGPARPVQQLPRQHALAPPGHRPHQVHDLGRVGQRPLRRLADQSRFVLREQLQRVRPHLAGQRPGRSALSRPGRQDPATPGAEQPGTDGPPGHDDRRPRHQRAR